MSKDSEDKTESAAKFCGLCEHHIARPPLLDPQGKLVSCGVCRMFREPLRADSRLAEQCPHFEAVL